MPKISEKELHQKLAQVSNLPSIPQNIIKIKKISENPNASAMELANCILSDHELTVRVLRMANSVYYAGVGGKISTITRGIMVLGFKAIQNIAISMSVFEVITKFARNSNFEITSFWIKSLACGIIAKFLASNIGKEKIIEEAFIAGFMHNIGQPLLAGIFPKRYNEIIKMNTPHKDIHKVERTVIGADHLQTGEFVARQWNLPNRLVRVISNHHRPGKEHNESSGDLLTDLVYLSDLFFPHVMGETSPISDEYVELTGLAKKLINISDEAVVELLIKCRQQIKEIAEDLEIDIECELAKLELPGGDDSKARKLLDEKEKHISFLQNSTDALSEAKDDEEILLVVCEAIYRGLQMGRVILFEYEPQYECYIGKTGLGVESQQSIQAMRFSAKEGLFKAMRNTNRAMNVAGEASQEYEYLVTDAETQHLEPKAFAAIPIVIVGEAQYVIFVDCSNKEIVVEDEIFRSIVGLTKQATLSLERNFYKAKMLSQV